MKPLLFVSSGLGVGGAEVVLLNLLRELDRSRFAPHVVSLTGPGDIGQRMTDIGVPVLNLDLRGHPIRDFMRLVRHVRSLQPAVVQTWMYHGDLIGSLAARLAGARQIAWGLHNSSLSAAGSRGGTIAVRRLLTWLSHRWPRVIISCSEVARDLHVELGYDAARFRVIGNGFDVQHFRPDALARAALRQQLGLAADTPLVINLGRYNAQKNQAGFLRAAALLRQTVPGVQVLMVGKGLDPGNPALAAVIDATGMRNCTHLLGLRTDTAGLIAASDLMVLASGFGEAFPLVLGEAMSCGVPCVATDVGDSRLLVADTGIIVPPLDEPALAAAMAKVLSLPAAQRQAQGDKARQRILDHYDIRSITRQYENIYMNLAGNEPCAA